MANYRDVTRSRDKYLMLHGLHLMYINILTHLDT